MPTACKTESTKTSPIFCVWQSLYLIWLECLICFFLAAAALPDAAGLLLLLALICFLITNLLCLAIYLASCCLRAWPTPPMILVLVLLLLAQFGLVLLPTPLSNHDSLAGCFLLEWPWWLLRLCSWCSWWFGCVVRWEWMRMRMGWSEVFLLLLLHYAQVISIYGELLV